MSSPGRSGRSAVSGQSCPASVARQSFIACASCQVRRIVSPIRPMPWESLLMMLMAPSSCSGPSAAMVAGWMRSRAASTSSGTSADPPCTSRIISGCSAAVAGPYGMVGVVEEHTTFGSRVIPIRSGT